MTDQQPTLPPPAARQQPIPIVRRHWDGNGWTQPAPIPAAPVRAASGKRGRAAS